MSGACTWRILEAHPLGRRSLGCIWILAFSLLRTLAEQVDFAFQIFDPLLPLFRISHSDTPSMDSIPAIMEKSEHLTRVDRYLATLEEFVSFFVSVRRLCPLCVDGSDTVHENHARPRSIQGYTNLEAAQTESKIRRQQTLSKRYIRHFEMLLQVLVSCNTSKMTHKLEQGNHLSDQFTRIGIVVASLAAVISPISLLTGFFGMNVHEFTSDATIGLYDFWQYGVPLLMFALIGFAFFTSWALRGAQRH